jgi:hypothetical protein
VLYQKRDTKLEILDMISEWKREKEENIRISNSRGGKLYIEKIVQLLYYKRDIDDVLDKEIALKLISVWNPGSVACHISRFTWLDKDVFIEIIKNWHWGKVVNLSDDVFSKIFGFNLSLDILYDIYLDLIDSWYWEICLEGSGYITFPKEKRKKLLLKLIENNVIHRDLLFHFDCHHQSILDSEVALKLIENWYFKENKKLDCDFHCFSWLWKEVALKAIKNWLADYVVKDLRAFSGIDKEVALELIKAWCVDKVEKNIEYFLW